MINLKEKISNLAWYDLINKLKEILGFIESNPTGIEEAPIDGNQYGRQNGDWTEITGGGGSQDLQQTTDNGNTTSNDIILDGNKKILEIDNAGDTRAIIGDTGAEGYISLQKDTGGRIELRVHQDSVDVDLFQFPTNPSITYVQTLATLESFSIPKTKTEIDAIIAAGILDEADGLKPNILYKISGVHPTLYDDGTTAGSTIYLRALTPTILAKEGYGEFYNPKYDKSIEGYGMYKNYSTWTATPILGRFDWEEDILGDGGQIGKLVGSIETGLFQSISGNWAIATSITGQSTGATASLTSIVLTTYAATDKVYWGGYSWINTTGFAGIAVDVLNLDSNWTKELYSVTTRYNKVMDIIEYDYGNDWISRRYEVEGANDVVNTLLDYNFISYDYSSISVFMFGNVYDGGPKKGIYDIKVYNGYFENINFAGKFQRTIKVNSRANQYNMFCITDNCQQERITLEQGAAQGNMVILGNQHDVSIGSSSSQYNIYIAFNGGQTNTRFNSGSSQYNMIMVLSQEQLVIESNCIVNGDTLGRSNTEILFATVYNRTVYRRPDGVVKIKYYNNSDITVIADITD